MKKHLVSTICCLLLFYLGSPLLLGQDAAPNLLSPQTRDFFHTVSHYTGQVNMSIPLYTYKDRDFEIPISLSYNASGFIPSKREGPVGLNWALNAGGAVVRKVNGLPDDCNGKKQNGDRESPMGIWIGIKNGKLANLNKQDLFELTVGGERDDVWATASDVEISPDEFSFVAPGLSGWFFINFDGTIKCGGDRPFVVDLNGMQGQPAKGTTIVSSTISITADNGYRYIFGGSKSEVEYSIAYKYERTILLSFASGDRIKDSSAVVTAWHLKEIIAPNGRVVTYNYRPFNPKTDYLHNVLLEQTGEASKYGIYVQPDITARALKNITKTVYLDNISIDSTVIKCIYSEKDRQFYGGPKNNFYYFYRKNDMTSAVRSPELKLNKIVVENNQNEITQFRFDLGYTGNGGIQGQSRLLLKAVTEQGQLPYIFNYYNYEDLYPDLKYPSPTTCDIDHWGFWTGPSTYSSLIPKALYVGNNFTYPNQERSLDTTYFQLALLKSITYPTKGKTTFFYDPNKYTHRLERRENSDYYPQIYEVSDFAGGARISAVENTDGRTVQRTRYTYPAGGVLMSWPNYYMTYEVHRPWPLSDVRMFHTQHYSYAVNQYVGESFIHYPEVIETRNSGEGYIHYKYTNYLNRPDTADFRTKIHGNTDNLMALDMLKHLQVVYSSRYFERGLLTDKLVYNASNQLIAKSSFDYSGIADYPNQWITGFVMRGIQVNSYKIYHCPITVKRETHEQYMDGGTVSSVVDYTYNNSYNNVYPATQTTIAGDGAVLKTVYHYVDGERDNASFAAMRAKNIRNIPVETINYKDGEVVGASLIQFQSFPDLGYDKWSVYPAEVLALELSAPINDYDTVTVDPRLKIQVSYERYDEFGNVLQQRNADGLTVSYIWSYNGLQKLAEVVGATYDELMVAKGNIDLSLVTPDAAYLSNMQLLRTALPQALITTYTYQPLVGMTSQTGPNGITTYYEYDSLNRLKTVRDHEGNVLKEYGYYYYEHNN